MPDFDFDKLKDQAQDYIQDHPDQVEKAKDLAKERLGNLFGGGKDDEAQDGEQAAPHAAQPAEGESAEQ
jgi:hypothetical protein